MVPSAQSALLQHVLDHKIQNPSAVNMRSNSCMQCYNDSYFYFLLWNCWTRKFTLRIRIQSSSAHVDLRVRAFQRSSENWKQRSKEYVSSIHITFLPVVKFSCHFKFLFKFRTKDTVGSFSCIFWMMDVAWTQVSFFLDSPTFF